MKNDSYVFKFLSEVNLLAVVLELYFAGTDTTSSNLYWAILYLAKYPDVQSQVRREILEQIGVFISNIVIHEPLLIIYDLYLCLV